MIRIYVMKKIFSTKKAVAGHSVFFKGLTSNRWTMIQWMAPHPKTTQNGPGRLFFFKRLDVDIHAFDSKNWEAEYNLFSTISSRSAKATKKAQ